MFLPAMGQESLLDQSVALPKQKTTVYDALSQVSRKTGCLFIYDSEIVKNDRKVRLNALNEPLRKLLDDILGDPGLVYKVLGRHILICRQDRTEEPPPPLPLAGNGSLNGNDSLRPVILRGHIYDRESRAAIPYATVSIPEGNIGTVTNEDGFFLLKLPSRFSGGSLLVSHLGYLNRPVPVQLLRQQQADIYLEKRVFSMQEVIIRYIDPFSIVEKAMDSRRLNYAPEPVYLTAFYREGVSRNDRLITYSEAVFRVYKSPFDLGESGDQVKLLRSRKVQSLLPSDTVSVKLKAGVQSVLQLDLVKCVPGFLDLSPPPEYVYRYGGLVSFNDREAYAIGFVQQPGIRKALYSGILYVEKDGFALLGADFEVNPDYIDFALDDFVLRKSLNLKVRLERISYRVSYLNFSGKYYLNHVRCDISLKTRRRQRPWYDRFNTFLEFVNCAVDTSAVRKFPKEETLKTGAIFAEQDYARDDTFWEGFNVIAPEASLSDALSKIIGKIEEIK